MHFHYRVTFTGYILCFGATTSHDLVTLTFDLLTSRVSCTVLLMSDLHTNFYYPTTIGYWVTSTEYGNVIRYIWSHFRYLKQSLRMRRVTWPLTGGKSSPHFWNPWPQFAYSLSHFHGATTFSHYEGYKVYCACAVSCDLFIGGPSKPHVTIFDPELPIHYTTFMGLRWRLRVVLY